MYVRTYTQIDIHQVPVNYTVRNTREKTFSETDHYTYLQQLQLTNGVICPNVYLQIICNNMNKTYIPNWRMKNSKIFKIFSLINNILTRVNYV